MDIRITTPFPLNQLTMGFCNGTDGITVSSRCTLNGRSYRAGDSSMLSITPSTKHILTYFSASLFTFSARGWNRSRSGDACYHHGRNLLSIFVGSCLRRRSWCILSNWRCQFFLNLLRRHQVLSIHRQQKLPRRLLLKSWVHWVQTVQYVCRLIAMYEASSEVTIGSSKSKAIWLEKA